MRTLSSATLGFRREEKREFSHCVQKNNTHVCVCVTTAPTNETWHPPLLEVEEDLPQSAAATHHVEIDRSQEGKVDFDNILSEKSSNH